jgi:hypothetical protein
MKIEELFLLTMGCVTAGLFWASIVQKKARFRCYVIDKKENPKLYKFVTAFWLCSTLYIWTCPWLVAWVIELLHLNNERILKLQCQP